MADVKIPIDRKTFPKFTTPVGVAKFPKLNTPDTKFKKEGEYTVKLVLPNDEAQKLIEQIDGFYDHAYAETAKAAGKKLKHSGHRGYGPATDSEKEEIEGFTEFSFKRKASGTRKNGTPWKAQITLVDAMQRPTNAAVWGGSKIRVAATIEPWFTAALGFGTRLVIRGVQVIELVTAGGESVETMGFDNVEGGYTAEAPASGGEQQTDGEAAGDGAEDDEDF